MVRLPDFQMNHGDSGILNLTYRLDATNQIQNCKEPKSIESSRVKD